MSTIEMIEWDPYLPFHDRAILVYTAGVGIDTPNVNDDPTTEGSVGPGGWAWFTSNGHSAQGYDPQTTSGRMALRAIREAMNCIPGDLLFISDNHYVYSCFKEGWWYHWVTGKWAEWDGSPTEHKQLWKPIIDAYEEADIDFLWPVDHPENSELEIANKIMTAEFLEKTKKLAKQAQAQITKA